MPMNIKDTLVYKYSFDNQSGLDTVILCSVNIDRFNSFYYAKPQNITGTSVLYSSHFGPGMYRYDGKGNLLAAFFRDIFQLDSLTAKDFKRLFPKNLYIGYSNSLESPNKSKKVTFNVVGVEDIQVANSTAKNCIKIQIEEFWPKFSTKYTAYVWLQKNTGVIKWIRTTNRLEELIYKSK